VPRSVALAAIALALATPHFAKPTTPLVESVPAWADEVASGDVNGDGLVDVIITRLGSDPAATYPVTIILNRGKGRFVDATKSIFVGAPPLTQHPRQIVVADFNGDGRADAFVADHGYDQFPYPGYPNTLILSQPGGKLIDASANLPRQPDFSHSAVAGDVDGNGTIDLYVGNLSSGCTGCAAVPPEILLNDGTGHFTVSDGALPTSVGSPYSPHYNGSTLVDVNGDGALDLVLGAARGSGASLVLLNDGTGHFATVPNALPLSALGDNSEGLGVGSGDINGDGRTDLVLAATKGDPFYEGAWLQVAIGNGDGTFRDETSTRLPGESVDSSPRWIAFPQLVDVNGTGSLICSRTSTAAAERRPRT
jgi:FG-GAP-like repeat